MEKEVIFDIGDDGLATITVNRPEARNALNWAAQEQFAQAVEELKTTPNLRVAIITAVGDEGFVSGGDLKELGLERDPSAGKRLTEVMGAALDNLTTLPVPVIGAINGNAIGGGCEILTACDLRISVASAQFRFAEVAMGLSTGWGGTARLVRLVGLSRALDLLMTGRIFDAHEAMAMGFINRMAPADGHVLLEAKEWAKDLAVLPKDALAAAKALAWAASNTQITEFREREVDHFKRLWLQADHMEAMNAFNEKRPPVFNEE